jgi:hypothetical protein
MAKTLKCLLRLKRVEIVLCALLGFGSSVVDS